MVQPDRLDHRVCPKSCYLALDTHRRPGGWLAWPCLCPRNLCVVTEPPRLLIRALLRLFCRLPTEATLVQDLALSLLQTVLRACWVAQGLAKRPEFSYGSVQATLGLMLRATFEPCLRLFWLV